MCQGNLLNVHKKQRVVNKKSSKEHTCHDFHQKDDEPSGSRQISDLFRRFFSPLPHSDETVLFGPHLPRVDQEEPFTICSKIIFTDISP